MHEAAPPPTATHSPVASTVAARPWLSFLIPAYNVEGYLRESVASVLSQADGNVEVLIVDDCSTDGTKALMLTLAREDGRVRCVFHEKNQGVSVTRNTLLDEAQGQYFWFLDADDYLAPGAVPRLRQIIDQHAPSLLMCDYLMVREAPKLKHRLRGDLRKRTFKGPKRQRITDTSVIMAGTFRGGQMHPWSKIARRELWGTDLRFPPGKHFEDMHLLPFLALRAPDLWYEPEVWVVYRQRQGSIMHTLNLRKADDLAWAMTGLREAVQAAHRALDADATFAWANTQARSFIGAARMAYRFDPLRSPEIIAYYRQLMEAASPLPVNALLGAYLRRGWWARALRLRHWLNRAGTPPKAQTP
ncbi:Glycosyltransferase involved in cell wall bisynthesis [Roseateles sp. YR242]|uniref:glycosyltransferase family 2 protein n=1 Tax=Roseateles sp. YR242 TaxID=1855305 RepID=UPI0008C47B1E|nr:glycosyltransferase family 2 protein [Roseateles sp. YR242]SEL42706.1 Glycosyltransferase involved in cell wall bisynthesis [Roseateles sp. YR242]